MSIPKIIHYCWLSGDPLPQLARDCMETWKAKLPDYSIVLWDLNKFNVDSLTWTKEAFDKKKYAFAADYIRFYALYHFGGIYLDTDVQVVRSLDELLELPYFMGIENPALIEAAVIGFEKGHPILKQMLDFYKDRKFVKENGEFETMPLPRVVEMVLSKDYRINKISSLEEFDFDSHTLNIFPEDFFSPKSCADGKIYQTISTYTIHHYNQSWQSPVRKYGRKIILALGGVKLKNLIKRFIFR